MNHKHDPINHEDDNIHNENYYDAGRYDTAAGRQPKDPYKKLRENYRKNHPEIFCRDSLFETKPANQWLQTEAANKQQTELFRGLWRTGELAVLFAESGAGKSILAMQIAESIARGRPLLRDTETGRHREAETRFPASAHHSVTASLPVLYLDLERSDAQFNARYRCPSPIPGRLPVKYRFSHQLRRTGYGDLEIPEAFNGNLGRYFLHSLKLTIDAAPEKVIVIDNLSCLDPRASGTAAAVRSMRSLKLLATIRQISILVITHAKPRRYHRSSLVTRHLFLNDIALGPHIAEIADSVFALGRSTFGENIRYIKHLESTAAPISHGESNVLVYQLERSEGPSGVRGSHRVSSPHVSKGQSMIVQPDRPGESLAKFPVSQNSQLSTLNLRQSRS